MEFIHDRVALAQLTEQDLARRLEEVFGNKENRGMFLRQTDEDAQYWLDKLVDLIGNSNLSMTPQFRSSMITVMTRLSKMSKLHPRCLFVENIHKLGKRPVASGGFGDVWKGVIGQSASEGRLVCLKVSRVYEKSDMDVLFREYLREANVWSHLKHPNVLQFLGIYYSTRRGEEHFYLISPWMENGNLLKYLKTTQRTDVDHLILVFDVAAGLAYLHREKIVHGDLKGLNILITPEGRACIADFGLSRVADTLALNLTMSTRRAPGTTRWLAREILLGGVPTKESDIYAFACVCYEIYTTRLPFHELANDGAVMLHIMNQKCPKRPPEVNDGMWNIMGACWNADSASRPKAAEILERIKSEALVEGRNLVESKPSAPQQASSYSLAPGSNEHLEELATGVEGSDFQQHLSSTQDGITTKLCGAYLKLNLRLGNAASEKMVNEEEGGRLSEWTGSGQRERPIMASDAELKHLEKTLERTFADKSKLYEFLAKKGHPAQQWLDRMQQASFDLHEN
ncbi:hypothetical protein PQX77_020370 [Marasmius sp. AFHP31]|nr:hypothetical protein PQX77_020370 [Marasmius sp. AFHP31]